MADQRTPLRSVYQYTQNNTPPAHLAPALFLYQAFNAATGILHYLYKLR